MLTPKKSFNAITLSQTEPSGDQTASCVQTLALGSPDSGISLQVHPSILGPIIVSTPTSPIRIRRMLSFLCLSSAQHSGWLKKSISVNFTLIFPEPESQGRVCRWEIIPGRSRNQGVPIPNVPLSKEERFHRYHKPWSISDFFRSVWNSSYKAPKPTPRLATLESVLKI